VYGELAAASDLPRKQVANLFDDLAGLIKADLGKKGPGIFTVPGLMKIKVVRKPATKARRGINPFTKEEMMFKAKPARNVVKVLALKGLKGMV
jgi:nucleoid DNA-binding protein